jgi:hypothetical protein
MADYSAVKSYMEKNYLHYFTFSLDSEKPMKAVIRHLPPDMPAEDISNSLEDLGFNIMKVRQMMATRTAINSQTHVEPLPLFLVTLTRNVKSQQIHNLNSLNYIIIKVELYRAQPDFTHCHNCHNFGHVWANCKQPP